MKARWLEAALIALLLGVLLWLGSAGLGFMPTPTATPSPTAISEVRLPARTPGGRGVTSTPTATPRPTATPTPTVSATRAVTTTSALTATLTFDGKAAYEDVLAQVRIGPRPSGSAGNQQTQDYISAALKSAGWQVEGQNFTYMNTKCRNLIGKANVGKGPVIILGAHFDTRRQADRDPDPAKRTQPVIGANDGASGVAVLLELARTLDTSKLPNEIWLAFFDAEDNGELDGWDWSAGSGYMAGNLGQVRPQYVIVVDMVGDADQQIYKEKNSTAALQDRIWQVASQAGYGKYFLPRLGYAMTDDHIPFLAKGLAAQDIIDFDYPYWHTTGDTADKVSAASLEHVGRTLQAFLQTLK